MSTLSTDSLQHQALFYVGEEAFLAGVLPFVREGLDAGEPVLALLPETRTAALRAALGAAADEVHFADAIANPGRLIAMVDRFAEEHPGPVRMIGEPLGQERPAAEVVECQLHEALTNLAFAEGPGLRCLCAYDAGRLDPALLREARRSHPEVIENGRLEPSREYRAGAEALSRFDVPFPLPHAPQDIVAFDRTMLREAREVVTAHAVEAGLDEARTHDLVLAVNEVTTNSVLHGGGNGVMRLWEEDGALVCEVRDRGHIRDPLAGRRAPREGTGGWGLWTAHQVADLVQVRSGADGTVARIYARLGA